jgi:hypothetical protein
MLMGDFDFEEIYYANRAIGPIYFVSYMALCVYVLMRGWMRSIALLCVCLSVSLWCSRCLGPFGVYVEWHSVGEVFTGQLVLCATLTHRPQLHHAQYVPRYHQRCVRGHSRPGLRGQPSTRCRATYTAFLSLSLSLSLCFRCSGAEMAHRLRTHSHGRLRRKKSCCSRRWV